MTQAVDELREKLRATNEQGELGLVQTIITRSLEELDQEVLFQEETNKFKSNIRLLTKLILDSKVSPYHLAQFLVPMIYKILQAEQEELLNLQMSSTIQHYADQIKDCLLTLHKICKDEFFRSSMCKLQGRLSGHCITNTELPFIDVRKELMAWQFRASQDKTEDPEYAAFAQQNVREIEGKIEKLKTNQKKVMELCEKYKVTT